VLTWNCSSSTTSNMFRLLHRDSSLLAVVIFRRLKPNHLLLALKSLTMVHVSMIALPKTPSRAHAMVTQFAVLETSSYVLLAPALRRMVLWNLLRAITWTWTFGLIYQILITEDTTTALAVSRKNGFMFLLVSLSNLKNTLTLLKDSTLKLVVEKKFGRKCKMMLLNSRLDKEQVLPK